MAKRKDVKYQVAWARKYPSTMAMIDRMNSKRNPKSYTTITLYSHAVMIYTKYYMNVNTPEEALEKTKVDLFKTVDDFITYLMEKREFTSKSARTMFYGVAKWLEANGVDISPLERINLPKSTITKTFDRSPTREELQKLLAFTDIRGRALVETAISSGLRVNTLLGLKWKDMNFEQEYAMIKVEPEQGRKSTRPFRTFITPEARKTLIAYKEFLQRKGKKTENENFVFANELYVGDRLSTSSSQMFWTRLLKTAGLAEKSEKYHVLHFHTLRKFFKTACTNAGCRREFIESWMGHSGEGLDDVYLKATDKEHFEQYRLAIPHLSVTETPSLIPREQLQKEVLNALPREFFEPLAQKHGLTVDELVNRLQNRKRALDTEEPKGIENPTALIKKKKETEDCQRIVSETELTEYLAKGWHFVSTLPSGKILVSNE